MLVYVGVQLAHLLFNFVHQGVILGLPRLLFTRQILVKLIQQREQRAAKVEQFLVHLGSDEFILAFQLPDGSTLL